MYCLVDHVWAAPSTWRHVSGTSFRRRCTEVNQLSRSWRNDSDRVYPRATTSGQRQPQRSEFTLQKYWKSHQFGNVRNSRHMHFSRWYYPPPEIIFQNLNGSPVEWDPSNNRAKLEPDRIKRRLDPEPRSCRNFRKLKAYWKPFLDHFRPGNVIHFRSIDFYGRGFISDPKWSGTSHTILR